MLTLRHHRLSALLLCLAVLSAWQGIDQARAQTQIFYCSYSSASVSSAGGASSVGGSSAASVASSAASVASSAASVASSAASVASSTASSAASIASSAGSSASYAPPAGSDFFVYDIHVMGQVTLLGSVNTLGGVQDIAVNKDGNVMVASPRPDRAMMIVNVGTPSSPSVSLAVSAVPNPGNAAATLEKLNLLGLGVSGAPTPDGMLRLMQMQLATGQPPSVSGTSTINTTYTVNRARIEPRGCYAFAALDNNATQLTVKKIVDPANPTQVQNYTDGIGTKGTGLLYDAWKDRLFLLSNNALSVLVPATPGTGSCP